MIPVDSCVEQSFFHKIRELDPLLTNTGASLALIGALPTYPSEKYGYLVPAAGEPNPDKAGYLSVSRFQEKPEIETARRLIEQKALWNCGVFAFKLRYLLSILEQNGWSLRYDELAGQYSRLPAISFDYQVAEKAENIVALTYEGMWKDLGTWNTLTEEMDTRIWGKGMISDDSDDTHVINELEIPVVVVGASGLVVACSPDGILVTKKAASHRVKDWIPSSSASPMFEERRWGWRRILDHTVYPAGDEVLIQKLGIRSGSNLSYHYHQKRKKLWKILTGEGMFVLDDQQLPAFSGDVLVIPAGARHALKAATNMELIEVQTGTELSQEDRTRIYTQWEEIERHLAGCQQDRNRKSKVRKNDG